MNIKTSGISQVVGGAIFALAGLAIAIAFLLSRSPVFSLFGLIVAAIGGYTVWSASNREIVIVKGGTSTIRSTKVFRSNTQEDSFDTSTVASVRLATGSGINSGSDFNNNSSNNSSNNQRTSTLWLVLKNNDTIEIASKSGSGGFSINGMSIGGLIQKAPLSKEASQVATFLGLQVDAFDSSNPAAAIKSVVNALKSASQDESLVPPVAKSK